MKNPFGSVTWKLSALEYALFAALIALGIIAAARALDPQHEPTSDTVGATLNAAP
jgi:Flp pilus assembly pilin Flp